jgi:hypothetical protein
MYIFEAVLDTNKFNQLIEELHNVVPQIDRNSVKARSAYFCIVGCFLKERITEEQKIKLGELIDRYIIHRYRCRPVQ